jgi:hypothetical protein
MRKILLSIVLLVSTLSLSAREFTYEDRVGVESILRQVVDQNLIESETITAFLEGSSAIEGVQISTEVVMYGCERAAGSDYCSISIYSEVLFDGEEVYTEHLETIEVRIRSGKVVSAKLGLIAG